MIACINYWVDPSQLFGNGRIEHQVATAMLAGHNASNLVNFDHRLLQKFYFEGAEEPKDIMVLGSSRIMILGGDQFPGHSFYNASVAGASIEDMVAIYQLMLETENLPDTLILEVGPWVFNRQNDQTRWKSLPGEYLRGLKHLGIPADWSTWLSTLDIEKYSALLSPAYLQESIRWWNKPNDLLITSQTHTGQVMKMSDGQRVFDAASDSRDQAALAALVRDSLAAPYSLTQFGGIDTSLTKVFELLAATIQADGVNLVIWLSPFQPDFYSSLVASGEYPIIVEAEDYLRSFAEMNNVPLVGSYDPTKIGCKAMEFYDAIHMRPECLARMEFMDLFGN